MFCCAEFFFLYNFGIITFFLDWASGIFSGPIPRMTHIAPKANLMEDGVALSVFIRGTSVVLIVFKDIFRPIIQHGCIAYILSISNSKVNSFLILLIMDEIFSSNGAF